MKNYKEYINEAAKSTLVDEELVENSKKASIKASNDLFSALIKYRKFVDTLGNKEIDEEYKNLRKEIEAFDDKLSDMLDYNE